MYEEDRIFGPLTRTQTLIAIPGVLAMLAVWEYYDNFLVACIPAAITLLLIHRFSSKIIKNPEEYFKRMFATDPANAQKKLQQKIAEVMAQIHERKARGMDEDLTLQKVLTDLQNIENQFGGDKKS